MYIEETHKKKIIIIYHLSIEETVGKIAHRARGKLSWNYTKTHTHRLSRNESVNCKLKVDYSVAQINVQHLSTQKNEFFILIQFDFSLRYKVSSILFFFTTITNLLAIKVFDEKIIIIFKIVYACLKSVFVLDFDRFIEQSKSSLYSGIVYTPANTLTTHPYAPTHTHTTRNILPCNSNLLIYLFSLFFFAFDFEPYD